MLFHNKFITHCVLLYYILKWSIIKTILWFQAKLKYVMWDTTYNKLKKWLHKNKYKIKYVKEFLIQLLSKSKREIL